MGSTLEEILSRMKVVAEGVYTTRAVSELALKQQFQTPIIDQVNSALEGKLSVESITHALMSRKLRSEAGRV
jgi:glycerol-3-phosphate dehydrogenase (NAD(P)+)